jgi:hypothetical protein
MLVVLGDSHGVAFQAGLKVLDRETRASLEERFGSVRAGMLQTGLFFNKPFFTVRNGSLHLFGDDTAAGLTRICGLKNPLAPEDSTIFGFCFGLHAAIFLRRPLWNTFTTNPHCETKQFLSDAVFRAMCLFSQRHVLAFFTEAKSLGLRFFVIAPPPLRQEFLDIHSDSGTPQEIRAMAQRFREIIGEALEEARIPVLLPPPEVSEAGALKPSLASTRAGDEHHGNGRYGALMWRHLVANADVLTGVRNPASLSAA